MKSKFCRVLLLSSFLGLVFAGCDTTADETNTDHQTTDDQATDNQATDISIPAICGDALTAEAEECDDGNTSSWDGCSSNCQVEEARTITLLNWNVLVGDIDTTGSTLVDGTTYTFTHNFGIWSGAAPVAPRAQAMAQSLDKMAEKPAFIAVMEFEPAWKDAANFKQLADRGYKMLYPNTPFMFTQLLYRTDRLKLIEKGYINLSYHVSAPSSAMKSAVTYGVFQEISTNEIFIGLSTHWEPNNGTTTENGFGGALDNVYYCEQVRMKQAEESVNLINSLRKKYPTAHIFYGGDLNTVDFSLIFSAAKEFLGGSEIPDFTLDILFTLLGSANRPGSDFTGAVNYMHDHSGLLGGRRQALKQGLEFDDKSTTTDAAAVKDVIGVELATPIIIDYNFFSPEMRLQSYQVYNDEPFNQVSDHMPVQLELLYYPRGQQELTANSYPDDSGTDFYLPAAQYQGQAIPFPTDKR